MFSRFFINRPVFATVLSLVIVIVGLVALQGLPVSQYPNISPPTVVVTTIYPGASAKTIADTVAQPIESQVNGVEGMLYMSSTCSNTGQYTLTVTFKVGIDLDTAQVQVQNRVAQAQAMLPPEVQRMGVVTQKRATNFIMQVILTSPDKSYDDLFLSNYASMNIKDELARVEGVGHVLIFGASDYSMRIWLDPEKMKARDLTATDVVSALREQNVQVAAGQVGQLPSPAEQEFQYTVTVEGRLKSEVQFGAVIIKSSQGRITRISDIARIELGASSYDMIGQLKGESSAIMGVFQRPGSNSLAVAERVTQKMDLLAKQFPAGISYSSPFNTTLFVEDSIAEVVETLVIAALLVCGVVLVFLQDWRATLIPAVTIPVSLIGTFGVMSVLGISINMISLFGIVLAIGIVVDDAIIVVENTVRNIDDSGLSPKEATIRAMQEVTGPIVATTLVLLAVFIPTAFLGGMTGVLYRQFALTIATATFFSALNALTLSPALSAIILRPTPKNRNLVTKYFNRSFDATQGVCRRGVSFLMRRSLIALTLYAGLCFGAYQGFISLPKGFVPQEDQGYAMVSIQLPDAASSKRTQGVVEQVNQKLKTIPGIKNWVSVPGYSLMDGTVAVNAATVWVIFEDLTKREAMGLNLKTMMNSLSMSFGDIQEASIFAFPPPAIMGLGNAGGFEMQLQSKAGQDLTDLQNIANEICEKANAQSKLTRVFSTFRANIPQLFVDVDRVKAKTLDVNISDIFDTLQALMGSAYVNDFNRFGKNFQVRVQADIPFRNQIEDIRKLEVRSSTGTMIPLSTLVSIKKNFGPQLINRYNIYPSAKISGAAAQGVSSGEAMALMEEIANATLPPGVGYEWTGISYQEKSSGGEIVFLLMLAVVFVYLVLSAQYESWSLPLVVILSVPPALLGTITAVYIRDFDISIYTQIGLVLMIALACKTAILIVEFARDAHNSGMELKDATLEAATLRFRPIIMTAFTFILGVVPLVVATGAAAGSRIALGTAVFGGMITATVFTIAFVPVFYYVIVRITEKKCGKLFKSILNKEKPKSEKSISSKP